MIRKGFETIGTLKEIGGVASLASAAMVVLGILFNPISTQSLLFVSFGYTMYLLPLYLLWLGVVLSTHTSTTCNLVNIFRVVLGFPALGWFAGSIELLTGIGSERSVGQLLFGYFGRLPFIVSLQFVSELWSLMLMLVVTLATVVFVTYYPMVGILHAFHDRAMLKRKSKMCANLQRPPIVEGPVETRSPSRMDQVGDVSPSVKKACPIGKQESVHTESIPMHDEALPISILPDPPTTDDRNLRLSKDVAGFEQLLIDAILRLAQIPLVRAEGTEPLVGISSMQFSFRPDKANNRPIKSLLGITYDLALEVRRSPIRITITDVVLIEVPLSDDERIFVYVKESLQEDTVDEPTYLIGKTIDGRPLELPVRKSLNMLVGGHVGTGKSVLLHSIIFGLIFRWKPSEVQLALYDHKVEEFKRYGTLPHLWHPVADSTKKFDLLLEKLEDELERRKRIRGLDDQAKFPLLVVIMDEFRGLASMRLTTLISECRSLGMTFILATQYPKAEEVSTPIKANLTTRVSFRMRDSTGSRLILGESGGETLMDQGDCLVSTSYCFEHAQAAHCRNEDLKAVENYLKTLGH